jgi:ketosteroid isomerase-like protein
MGEEARNVEPLKASYRRWHDSKGGSVDHWMGMVAEDVRFGSIAGGAAPLAFTGPRSNRDAVRSYFDGLLSEFEMLHYTIHDYIAQGDVVFVRAATSWRNRKTGKTFETPKADFWRLRDGRIVEFYEYYDTAQVVSTMS